MLLLRRKIFALDGASSLGNLQLNYHIVGSIFH